MRRKRNNNKEQGFVVVLALIGLMAMSFFLMTGAATTSSTLKISGNYSKTVDGFNLAEVGLAKSRVMLEATEFDTLLTTYTQTNTPLIPKTNFNKGKYQVWIADNSDGDGQAYNDSDNILIVTSIGENASGGNVTIDAHIQKNVVTDPEDFPPNPPGGAGAAMLCGTTTDIKTTGSAGISGHDFGVPTIPCAGIACAGTDNGGGGYAVVGSSAVNESGSGYESNMTPGIAENVGMDTQCDEWKTLRDQMAELDDSSEFVEVLTGSGVELPLNDCSNPKVFIINTPEPTFRFSGTASLCGVVVVASNTSIQAAGNVTLIGLILIMGESANLQFVADTGTARLFGQVIVESSSVDTAKELELKGSTEINYSSEGLGFANQAMNNALSGGGGGGGLITMAWKETY